MSPSSRRRLLGRLAAVAAVPSLSAVTTGSRPGVAGSSTDARPEAAVGSTGVEWKRIFGDGDFQCHGLIETDRGVVLLGRTDSGRSAEPWVAEVGPDGEPLWQVTVDGPGFSRAVDAVPAGDGYTVLVTVDRRPPMLLVRLDGDGEEQWRTRTGGPIPQGIRILDRIDDGYLVGGFRGDSRHGDAELEAWLRATDDEGYTRWERTYGGSVVADVREWDDGFLLAGHADDDAWLQAVGPEGDPRWRHTYGGVDAERAVATVPAGEGVFYGGWSQSSRVDRRRGMLVRTTADGRFAWRRMQDLQRVVDLVPYGGGFAVTGEPRNPDGRGRNPEKPVHVVDRWGRVEATTTVNVDPGAPVGLAQFDDGALAVGGWDGYEGVWLAKVRPD